MNPRNILIGVCGGVAAYKALDLVSALRKQGHRVRVVMTEAACRFVQPASFTAVSGSPAMTTMWPEHAPSLEDEYPHLYPATSTEIFILVPATANTLAKIAGGFGSDLLSTCCLSLPAECHRVFCPAMNVEMWHNRAVQENVRKLEAAGWQRLGPASGHLACGMTGEGRLMEPADILTSLTPVLENSQRLKGKTLLILSGPTREHLDPVRFIGNPSSGLMGRALAEEAVRQGASVRFVTGPVPEDHLPRHPDITLDPVTGAVEMLEHARKHLAEADGILYVAAVADYRPATTETEKRPKSKVGFELTLVPNPDLAATLNAEKSPDTFTVGFALQTQSGEDAARQKLQSKHLDGIVLNYADSMGSTSGHFSYLAKGAEDFLDWGALPKPEAARRILGELGGQDSVEVRVQRSECRGQSAEVRVQRSEYRGQSAKVRVQRSVIQYPYQTEQARTPPDLSPLTSHPDLSPLTSDLSPLTSDLSPLTSDLSPLTSDLSPLTSDLSP